MTRRIALFALAALLLTVACSSDWTFGPSGGGPDSVIGDCQAGTTLQVGEGCTVAQTDANDTFWVKQDGGGCYLVKKGSTFSTSSETCVDAPFFDNDGFATTQNDDGSWTVVSVP